jgi:CBS domain-containing protein
MGIFPRLREQIPILPIPILPALVVGIFSLPTIVRRVLTTAAVPVVRVLMTAAAPVVQVRAVRVPVALVRVVRVSLNIFQNQKRKILRVAEFSVFF